MSQYQMDIQAVTSNTTRERYFINAESGLLTSAVSSTWNISDTGLFILDYKKTVQRHFASEWSGIFDVTSLEMLIPDDKQIALFRALFSWSYLRGMTDLCMVVGQAHRSALLYQLEEITSASDKFNTLYFGSQEDAKHWLEVHGKLTAFNYANPSLVSLSA